MFVVGEWEKKANFELTTRVPLIIAAPHLSASHGKSTQGTPPLSRGIATFPPPLRKGITHHSVKFCGW